MRSRGTATLAAAMVLIVFASSCRRVMVPRVDPQGSVRESLTGILQIIWPGNAVAAPIRVHYSNSHEISNSNSPLRRNDIIQAYGGGEVVIGDLVSTTYMVEVSWVDAARHSQSWVFGPLSIAGATTSIDLGTPNLNLTPRLRVDGAEVAIEEVEGWARTQRIGNTSFSARSEGDSTLAFFAPPGETQLGVRWVIDGPPYGPKRVSADQVHPIEVPGARVAELNLSRMYLRVNTRLSEAANWNASIQVKQPEVGEWLSITSEGDWRPGEITTFFTAPGPFQLELSPPYRWRDVVFSRTVWAEPASGDTLDLDLGGLSADLRILDGAGRPVAFTPLALDPVTSDLRGRLRSVTDDRGEASYLLDPGTYDLEVQNRWTRRFTVTGDTLIVLTEES